MPCPGSDREIRTARDLTAAFIEEREGRICANGKLQAVAEIMEGARDD